MATLQHQVSRQLPQGCHSGVLWVYLNGRCNFTCSYCLDGRNSLKGRAKDHPDFRQRLGELQRALGFTLVLTGGEPLLDVDLVIAIFSQFESVPKTIQTNAGLPRQLARVLPHFGQQDWLSVSVHDQTLTDEKKHSAVLQSIETTISSGNKVFAQLMCSPGNLNSMLEEAARLKRFGCRVNLRRLFEHDPALFAASRPEIEAACSDAWATPSFFGDAHHLLQPFRAAVVYLDGRICMVCRDEVPVGNLYSGYDLAKVEHLLSESCDSVCHCCSCLWLTQSWGFA